MLPVIPVEETIYGNSNRLTLLVLPDAAVHV